MSTAASSPTSNATNDECSICLNALATGLPLLTLSCGHKFHLQCLSLNVKAQNKECPLCRAALETSLSQLLSSFQNNVQQQQQPQPSHNYAPTRPFYIGVNPLIRTLSDDIPSVEEPVDEAAIRTLSSRVASNKQAAASSTSETFPLITASTTLEFGGQISHQEANIYGLVTLKAPSINLSSDGETSSALSRVPIDLVCVVDQSASMRGEKMILLKETLVYIAEQLNKFDRLAIISFDTQVFDRSHGLKRMDEANQEVLKRKINDDIHATGGTYIGCGLEKGINIFTSRQTKNPVSALLLLTDGQDSRTVQDYSQLMQTFPEDVSCHTFGYGPDHSASLLAQLAEQGNNGSFTYVDQQQAVGPAFATVIGGLLSCIAKTIRVNLEFDGEYQVTHVHSKFKYEPVQLPSSKITYILNDLNADEERNLVFQLHVPKINKEQSVDMLSQEPMSQSLSEEEVKPINNHVIGHVSITYIDPKSSETLNTTPVPFHLIRASQLPADLLQINHTLDRQRNRVETAFALKQAMDENNYMKSLAILKAQVDKIEASVSAQDPFCQQLINDLKYRYPTERDYRSTHKNSYLQQSMERGTYSSPSVSSAQRYQTPQQQQCTKKDDHHLIAAKYDPEMPKRVRQLLEQIGDNPILKIQLGRTPVEAVLLLFLNFISSWKFSRKQLELGYDEIYHNYLLITINNQKGPNVLHTMIATAKDTVSSTIYKLEKSHRVRLMKPVFPTEFVDTYDIPLTPHKTFTLNRLITTVSNIDKHFYSYDAGNNNMCQTFVENIVDINGLTPNIIDNAARIALKPQDAKALVATLGSRSDIVKRITDLGGTLDKLVFDRRIKWKKPLVKEFNVFGDMHIKVANDAGNGNTDDILQSSGDAVIVNGTTDIVIQNSDDIFNAVVSLEKEDKEKERNQKIATILGILLIVILLVGAAAIIAFVIWRKRKDKLKKNELINNIIDTTKSDSNLSESSNATNNQ